MRQRNKPWAKDRIASHPEIVIHNPQQYKGNWKELFGNHHPIYIEVGTGKGKFITEMAENHPNVNYIGIELSMSIIVTALDKVIESEQQNVKLLNENASVLADVFAQGEIDRVYLNFSDPWPKNRHEKRRLTYESFLKMYQDIMKKNGEIHFKTDNRPLYEYSLHSFSKYGMVLNNVSLDLHQSDIVGNVMTEYEEKFSEKGNRIYRVEAVFRN
jgi:tRNA (guanine-N7-)-methyltransferase